MRDHRQHIRSRGRQSRIRKAQYDDIVSNDFCLFGVPFVSNPGFPIDSAAAAISEDRLSDLLTLVHREGFGHNAQVVRPERGQPRDRLRRAGLGADAAARLAEEDRPIVMIFAPERVDAAVVILRRGGATTVERFTQFSGTPSALIGFDPAALQTRRAARRGGTAQGQ